MGDPLNPDIVFPRRRRKGVPWRRDLIVLRRLPEVERRHLAGEYNTVIAAALGVDEQTVRMDIKRLHELWKERAGDTIETMRIRAAAELDDIRRRSLQAAEWDQACERAVLFDDLDGEDAGFPGGKPAPRSVYRDMKGAASFRGQKAQSLNVARQAIMDKVKLLGLSSEKGAEAADTDDPIGDLSRAIERSMELLELSAPTTRMASGDGGI